MKTNKENEKEITYEDAMVLNEAIGTLLMTSPTMKGKLVFNLNRVQGKLKSVSSKIQKAEQDILKKHVELDKKGDFVLEDFTEDEMKTGMIPPGVKGKYKYLKGEEGQKAASDDMTKFLQKKIKVELRPIQQHDFDVLDINTVRNPNIGAVIEHLVQESEMNVV